MEIQKERPPYVTFEIRAEEDREKSIESGIYSTKDVDYAIITPAGSKDRIERRVDEWLENMQQQAQEGRVPMEWVRAYRDAYKAWKEDRQIPDSGHPIVNWPAISPAQIKSLLDLRVRTIEDLAEANEETLNRIGMGSRTLKQRAQDWLDNAKTGATIADLTQLRADLDNLRVRNETLEAQNRELAARLDAGKTPQHIAQKL